jgi:secernin
LIGCWGCEHGVNEYGVVIGNEAVWTRIPQEEVEEDTDTDTEERTSTARSLLLGMDLVRLGLERGKTSKDVLNVITQLLEEYGQGGPCAENDPTFTYHNSFLIADINEAYILETAGRHWVAKRITTGSCNISNELTIRTELDLCSIGIKEYAKENNLWDNNDGIPFDFAAIFSDGGVFDDVVVDDEGRLLSTGCRQGCGRALLNKHSNTGKFNHNDMISILRDHDSGICMHVSGSGSGGFETTASMVTELYNDNCSNKINVKNWTTGPYPCKSTFCLQEVVLRDENL